MASKKIRSAVTSFRVTLTQGNLSRSAWTPADPAHPHGMPLVRGVLIDGAGNYNFILGPDGDVNAALAGSTWLPKPKATLLIEALASNGKSIYQQSKTFTFTLRYPNGKACDKVPSLYFFTTLVAADQIAPIG
jgi:hypothetical protein